MSETKTKGRPFDLPETKGTYQLKGIVSGVKKEGFYKETKTKTGRDFRMVKFGLAYNEDDKPFNTFINGTQQDNVYFSKRNDDGKTVTEKVPWTERFTFKRDGYRLIGKNVGVTKVVNSEGNIVNDKKSLTDFDCCKELSQYLKDGTSLFTKGSIDFSSFVDDKGNKRSSVKLVPNQLSLCSDIHFKDENYKQQNDFNQIIVYTGIDQEKDENEKPTGRFVVSAKIVTYKTIEDAEFFIENKDLANIFRKKLKPYYAIKVNGNMVTRIETESVTDDEDNWGEEDAMEKANSPVRYEFIVTGAKPSTIEKELYSEEKIAEAIAAINRANKAEADFGNTSSDSDDWGSGTDLDVDDDDDAWD